MQKKIGRKLKANAEEDWKETEGKCRRSLGGS